MRSGWGWLVAGFCAQLACSPPTPVRVAAPSALTVDELMAKVGPAAADLSRDAMAHALDDRALLVAEARRRGLSERPLLKDQVLELEERLLVKELLAELERQVVLSDVETAAAMATTPTKAAVKRRLVRVLLDASKRTELERLRSRVIAGQPVAVVAALGEGAEHNQGGDIGWIDDSTADPTLLAMARALNRVGDVSAIAARGGDAYFVVLQEISAAQPVALSEARAPVAAELRERKARAALKELLRTLRPKPASTSTAATPLVQP